MNSKNMTDLIEQYLKAILQNEETIEIKRAEMADHFSCVPSQINYVINTRFTLAQGYTVESKRGGGGYIRIQKVKLNHSDQLLTYFQSLIAETLTLSEGQAILGQLYQQEIVTEKEYRLLLAAISYEAIGKQNPREDYLRASLLKAIIDRLRYEEKR